MVLTPRIIPVILCGGVGSRLWPISRATHPKFFIRLADNQSFLQKTLLRAVNIPGVENIITVSNQDLLFKIKSDYDELSSKIPSLIKNHYILEPFGRNTAPAVLMAALKARDYFKADTNLLVLAADHLISDNEAFSEAVMAASELSDKGKLVTFGIHPTRPETGFGYIEHEGSNVIRFVEKPNRAKAQEYIDSGRFLWNSGMFCFRTSTLIDEMELHCNALFNVTLNTHTKSKDKSKDESFQLSIDAETFKAVPDESIDYALMEKSENVSVVTLSSHWQDIGSWQSFGEMTPADDNQNRIKGQTILKDTTNCTINTEKRLVAGVGLDDLVIIDTADALLVAKKNRTQEVKQIYQQLKENNHETYKIHQTVYRPWGTYTILEEGPNFKIKRIVVNPEASLSLQMHHHRSEHWVVVSGCANVQNGENTIILKENESTFIPPKTKHRLQNLNQAPLIIIEVQTGSYLGEDDIVRFDDVYGRVG